MNSEERAAAAPPSDPNAQAADPAPADGEQDLPAPVPTEEVKALTARVDELEKQLQDERDLRLRTVADFQNFRRRTEQERGENAQFANRELILGLLPIMDNFERALASADESHSYESLMKGVQLTLRQLQEYLKKNGVEPIEAVGKEFDPNFHEAIMRVEDGEHPDNTVVDEVQRGYTMRSRVLRPSMVKVAHR